MRRQGDVMKWKRRGRRRSKSDRRRRKREGRKREGRKRDRRKSDRGRRNEATQGWYQGQTTTQRL